MKILMLDCETLALTPDAVITQIAAGCYDLEAGEMLSLYSWHPNLDEQASRRVDPNTVMWWLQQSGQARNALQCPAQNRRTATQIEAHVSNLLRTHQLKTVWASPAMFDLPLLTNYFGSKPWSYRDERDMSTIKRLFDPHGEIEATIPTDEQRQHDAAYDVEWQCAYLHALYLRCGRFLPQRLAEATPA
jgi:hypothetical protein